MLFCCYSQIFTVLPKSYLREQKKNSWPDRLIVPTQLRIKSVTVGPPLNCFVLVNFTFVTLPTNYRRNSCNLGERSFICAFAIAN